jgi:hypothetical protein
MSTRPSSPAAAQAKTLFARPGVGIWTGADQWFPSSVEYEYISELSPAIFVVASYGACSQTAYRLPALSIARVGKFPPVRTVSGAPRSATGRSTQFRPLGSLTFGIGAPNATGKQRAIRILLRLPSSWMTYTCFTACGSVAPFKPVLVATGLTSLLPMIPSSHEPGSVMWFGGPRTSPADAPAPATGERYMTSVLLSCVLPHSTLPLNTSSFVR